MMKDNFRATGANEIEVISELQKSLKEEEEEA